MSVSYTLSLVGGWLFLVFVLAPLMSRGFCTRNAPRWAREWRDVAGALVGLRILTRDMNQSSGEAPWWVVLVWVHLAIAQTVVAAYGVWNAMYRGDRCSPKDDDQNGVSPFLTRTGRQ